MSDMFPVLDGWAGFGELGEALLRSNEAWDSDDPRVRARPELFKEPELGPPVRRGPGRPPGSRNKPKDESADG